MSGSKAMIDYPNLPYLFLMIIYMHVSVRYSEQEIYIDRIFRIVCIYLYIEESGITNKNKFKYTYSIHLHFATHLLSPT